MPTRNLIWEDMSSQSSQSLISPRISQPLNEAFRSRARGFGRRSARVAVRTHSHIETREMCLGESVFDSPRISEIANEFFSSKRAPSFEELPAEIQGLYDYLTALSRNGEISEDTKRVAWGVWQQISDVMAGQLPVPDASSGPDGEVAFIWDQGKHHLSVEIFPGGAADFFYRNRETEEAWIVECLPNEFAISSQVKGTLELFS